MKWLAVAEPAAWVGLALRAASSSPFGMHAIARGWRWVAFDKKCGSFVDIE
jgi:hypothetical protein